MGNTTSNDSGLGPSFMNYGKQKDVYRQDTFYPRKQYTQYNNDMYENVKEKQYIESYGNNYDDTYDFVRPDDPTTPSDNYTMIYGETRTRYVGGKNNYRQYGGADEEISASLDRHIRGVGGADDDSINDDDNDVNDDVDPSIDENVEDNMDDYQDEPDMIMNTYQSENTRGGGNYIRNIVGSSYIDELEKDIQDAENPTIRDDAINIIKKYGGAESRSRKYTN